MKKIDHQIVAISKNISTNIETQSILGRGFASQNIMAQLRNFVEHIALKEFANGNDIENSYPNIQKAITYISTRGELKFLNSFHKLLQITASHYTLDEENSVRMMLKYYEYLLRAKNFLKQKYNFDILDNLETFPLNLDPALKEYYQKIAEVIKQSPVTRSKLEYDDRYYIQKIKPFFVDLNIFYEVTFTRAIDKISKFDRIIAFTKLEIIHNYAVKLSISKSQINVMGKSMPIQVIDNWEVSIRPCELNNFAVIFGKHQKHGGNKEYYELMQFIKTTKNNLVDLINSTDSEYEQEKDKIKQRSQVQHFYKILDQCRNICKNNLQGCNVIKYLLYKLNNKIIKNQWGDNQCKLLSNLELGYGCIPFDQMPYATSLINHNPRLFHLFECIDPTNRQHELFARYIKNNTEIHGMLYTPISDIQNFEDIPRLVDIYNNSIYRKHPQRRIENFKGHLYINGYEKDTFKIVDELIKFSDSGLINYQNSVNSWLQSGTHIVDCKEKSEALSKLFENSKIALIYGAAGTGKSTMINHISNFFKDELKLFLANTNTAIDNLKRKVSAPNCHFRTIAKHISPKNLSIEYDIIIIDECSTVSNAKMKSVLSKSQTKLLVLVGDVFQIESIRFGNWFSIVKTFINENSIFNLTKPYRSKNDDLLLYWDKVRNIEESILELSAKKQYSVSLDDSIFESQDEDTITLCLNYDGLYGINNINRFLQASNPNNAVEWGIETYKINDPILFNDNARFGSVLYNNLKGRIIDINLIKENIQFDIEIDRVINEMDIRFMELELLENSENEKSLIRFIVNKYGSTDEDDTTNDTIVPFQVSYAVSIHKAQGLEYNSVRVVITNEVEEVISHNIFYTAITRARSELKIYWSPETERKVLSTLKTKFNKLDVSLLKTKYMTN